MENPENLPVVNHKDEDVTNNKVSNLEWCSVKYNNNYGTRNNKIAKAKIGNLGKAKAIKKICSDGTEIIYPSVNEAARQLGIRSSSILASMKRNGKCKNSRWEYL